MYIIEKICEFDGWVIRKIEKVSYKIEDWTGLSNFGQAKVLIGLFAIGNMLKMGNFWNHFLDMETSFFELSSSGLSLILSLGYLFLANQGESHSNWRNLSWVTDTARSREWAIVRTLLLLYCSPAVVATILFFILTVVALLQGIILEIALKVLTVWVLVLASITLLFAIYLLAVTPRPPELKFQPAPLKI